jgi:hypothetical protein
MSASEWIAFGTLVLIALEMALIRAHLVRGHYLWRDTMASIAMRAGNYASNLLLAGAVVATFSFLHVHRLFDISPASPWAWAAWFPLALLGFPPAMIFAVSGINLLYQYWIHTETIRRMPAWFEYLFNTPSNHRVHHAVNPRYLDRNYAGMFMVWDRLFGTFVEERDDDPPRYGLVHNISTYNPLRIAFHEWAAIARDLRKARSLREAFGYVFGPPGWRPDGNGPTARNIRRLAGIREPGHPVPAATGCEPLK